MSVHAKGSGSQENERKGAGAALSEKISDWMRRTWAETAFSSMREEIMLCLMLVNSPVKGEALMMQKTEVTAVSRAPGPRRSSSLITGRAEQSKRQR